MQTVLAAIKKLPPVRRCRAGLGSEPALQKLSLFSLLQLLSRPSAPVGASVAGCPPENAACGKLAPAPSSGQRLPRQVGFASHGRLQLDRAIFPALMLFLTPAVGAGVVVRAAWLAPVGQALRTRRAGAFSLPSQAASQGRALESNGWDKRPVCGKVCRQPAEEQGCLLRVCAEQSGNCCLTTT